MGERSTHLVLERLAAGLVIASVPFVLEDVDEVADRADNGLPRTAQLDASQFLRVPHQSGEVLLTGLDVGVPVPRLDSMRDLLVHVLATANDLGVLAGRQPHVTLGFGRLRAVDDGLQREGQLRAMTWWVPPCLLLEDHDQS